MLEKLAKQTAVYGISTIAVRFLNYLLTPYLTRVFGPETYGIVVDVYALIPFALVLLSMGMESGYFRFATRAEQAGGDVNASKRRLFGTTWGATSCFALLFFAVVALLRHPIAGAMGASYAGHADYIVWVGLIVLFDVLAVIPFARLREQGRALTYVMLRAAGVAVNVVLAVSFGMVGLYDTPFGVGWVFVANLAGSVLSWLLILRTADGAVPRIDPKLLRAVFLYSLPLLVSGIAGTANEFIDRQMIKYLVPEGAMGELGIYGAITKIAVVMVLFTQMYRLAAEPFFLSNFRKTDFVQMNAAALKYFVMASMVIFLLIAMFRDLFALIVGPGFREGIFILPIVLGANILSGVWLNLSFWYKREERTSLAMVVTFTGLVFAAGCNVAFVPRWGYYGAAWARFVSEASMVAVSFYLNRRFYPTPYPVRRIAELVAVALGAYFLSGLFARRVPLTGWQYVFNLTLLAGYLGYVVRRERIDVGALMRAVFKRG